MDVCRLVLSYDGQSMLDAFRQTWLQTPLDFFNVRLLLPWRKNHTLRIYMWSTPENRQYCHMLFHEGMKQFCRHLQYTISKPKIRGKRLWLRRAPVTYHCSPDCIRYHPDMDTRWINVSILLPDNDISQANARNVAYCYFQNWFWLPFEWLSVNRRGWYLFFKKTTW